MITWPQKGVVSHRNLRQQSLAGPGAPIPDFTSSRARQRNQRPSTTHEGESYGTRIPARSRT
jgi:hypothetical protein